VEFYTIPESKIVPKST